MSFVARLCGTAAVVSLAVVLTGCAGPANARSAPDSDWVPIAHCPSPSVVTSAAGVGPLEFAAPADHERAVDTTGCTYRAEREGTQVAFATQPGTPAGVVYDTASGVKNVAEPSLGRGAHFGLSSFFCGVAVPVAGNRTVTLTILATTGTSLHCTPLRTLLKLAAVQHR
jgi:hypothetical protein